MKATHITLSLLSLLAAANANPLPRNNPPTNLAVTVTASLPRSPIHARPLAASGGKFWIGKPTSHYCPPNVEAWGDCPKGNDTSIGVGNPWSSCSMNVIVPGGQQVYVAPDGSLSFTKPHSAYIPPGSTTLGFGLLDAQNNGLRELVTPSYRIFACPQPEGSGVWQVFVPPKEDGKPSFPVQCLEFKALTLPATAPVWEYN